MFINVALNIPADKLFTYEVPANLQQEVEIGKRVFVPFGNRKRTGFITKIILSCDLKNIKSITEILDDEPLFGLNDLHFYEWIANYFMYPLGKALAELIPSGSEKKDFLWITSSCIGSRNSSSPGAGKTAVIFAAISSGHSP